jgi:hypothetical protein
LLIGALAFITDASAQTASPFGFEDNTTNGWTGTASSETATVNAATANVRTGGYSLKVTTTSTGTGNKQWYSNTPYGTSGPTTNVHFIYWAKAQDAGTSADASYRYASSAPPTGTGSSSNASTATALSTTSWKRIANSSNTSSVRYYFPSPRKTASAGATSFYLDDGIIYTSASAIPDTVKPATPTALSGSASGNLIARTWTSNTDPGGVDATGVAATVLLRTNNVSATLPDLNDQAAYSVAGGAAGPNTVGDWTVISATAGATATTYMDATSAPGNYKYAVVLRDLAHNYSAAAGSATIVAGSPVPTVFLDTAGFIGNIGNVETGGISTVLSSYKVSGFNLVAPVTITAPGGFEVSITNSTIGFNGTQSIPVSSGTLAPTTVYVRFVPTSPSGATGLLNITNASGSSSKTVAISGNAIAHEPTATGSISFGIVRSTRIEVNLPTIGSGNKRIIVVKSGGDVDFLPVDGISPGGVNASFTQAADQGNGNKIVYDGAGSGNSVVLVTGLTPGTIYYFAVYEYNAGTGTSQNYLPTSPVTSIARTADNDLSIGNGPSGSSISIYPNPVENVLHINAPKDARVTINDLAGRVVYTAVGMETADMSRLSAGTYLVVIRDNSGAVLYTQRLAKNQ